MGNNSWNHHWKTSLCKACTTAKLRELLQEIIPVVEKGWTKRQHRGTGHSNTRTGSEHKKLPSREHNRNHKTKAEGIQTPDMQAVKKKPLIQSGK